MTRPTRTALAGALAVTAVAVAGWLTRVGPTTPALVGIAGAVGFAAAVRAVDRSGGFGRAVASVLVVPVAVAGAVGTLGLGLVLVGDAFPVATPDRVPSAGLLLVSRAGLAAGCTTAALGAALAAGGPVGRGSLARFYRVALATAAVPLGAAVVAGCGAVLAAIAAGRSVELADVARGAAGWLVAPGPGLHLGTLCLLVAAAALSVRAAAGALPVAEVLADTGAGETRAPAVRALRRRCRSAALAAGLATPVGFAVDATAAAAASGGGVARLVAGVARAPLLRGSLAAVAAVGLAAAGLAGLLRRGARGSARRSVPLAVGAGLTAVAFLAGEPVFEALVGAVAARLPGPFADGVRAGAGAVADFYGAGTVVVALTALLACLTAFAALLLRVALWSRYLAERTAGVALAGAGLFGAAAFAGTLGTAPLAVFAGVAAALLVRESGAFATALGREVGGDAPTRSVELVHAGGAVAVGALGVGASLALRRVLAGVTVGATPTAAPALLAALAALLLLVAALR